jgi:predicted nucleotidyltransferase
MSINLGQIPQELLFKLYRYDIHLETIVTHLTVIAKLLDIDLHQLAVELPVLKADETREGAIVTLNPNLVSALRNILQANGISPVLNTKSIYIKDSIYDIKRAIDILSNNYHYYNKIVEIDYESIKNFLQPSEIRQVLPLFFSLRDPSKVIEGLINTEAAEAYRNLTTKDIVQRIMNKDKQNLIDEQNFRKLLQYRDILEDILLPLAIAGGNNTLISLLQNTVEESDIDIVL